MNAPGRRRLLFALCAGAALGWVGQARGAGVTVVTHGFNGNVTSWVIPMMDAIAASPDLPGTTSSCYRISITRDGSGQTVASATFLGGVAPDVSDSGEILIKLDWSTISGGEVSTTTVANAAVDALLSTTLIPQMNGNALVELPLHLVGHSRGGSVVTEMARLLGARNVWVDHVTTLDPRPVSLFSDAAVATYANVLYADNYWQTLGDGLFVPNGQSLAGAYNRKLLTLNGGYSSPHSDVHLWYHGTIDLDTSATDTQATIGAAERSQWWTVAEAGGASTGFLLSAIVGGDRLSAAEPAGVGTGRINAGFNRRWDLGGGVAANRTALPSNNGTWPNLIRVLRADTNPVVTGDTLDLTMFHQSGADNLGTVNVRTSLDANFNPYDGTGTEIDAQTLATTGTNAVATIASAPTVNVSPGTYALCTRIGLGTRVRYLYLRDPVVVVGPPTLDASTLTRLGGGSIRFRVNGAPGLTVKILASANLTTWTPIATQTLTGNAWDFTDTAAGTFPQRFYKTELGP
jgi:pimeloyl-ACP methyl ester carboxylesterase